MGYKVKEQYEKTTTDRLIPGFGQKKFEFGKMTSEEVAKWIARGAQIEEYFDYTEDSEDQKKAKKADEPKKDAGAEDQARERYRGRIDRLKAEGFVRVSEDFKHENGKVISAKDVADLVDSEFDKFMTSEIKEDSAGSEYEGMNWADLQALARKRKVKATKKAEIIAELIEQDKAA